MLQLPTTANLGAAAELAHSLGQQMASGQGPVVVDASALHVYDSSTIALLLQLHRQAQAAGRAFELRSPPSKLVELARLYGVDALLCAPSSSPESAGVSPVA